MTAKLDGTNGLLQQYAYLAATTGFSYTFAAGTTVLVMQPAGTLATGTITMPASPVDGMTITFSSTQTITALTVNANAGQSIVSAPTVLPARQAGAYIYRLANTTWYPYESVPTNVPTTPAGGSIITSGTALTAPPATPQYFDFTSIPSWVKRITVMFQGVSTSGTSNIQIQIGAGSVTTSGYVQWASNVGQSLVSSAGTGFAVGLSVVAADARNGIIVLANITGNTWVLSSNSTSPISNSLTWCNGNLALGGTLDRIRITTVNGTDTFDAGSINILYE